MIRKYKFKLFFSPDADTKLYGNIQKRSDDKKILDEEDLTFDESFTLVCNGARASCSNHVMSIPTSAYLNPTSSSMSTIALPFSGFQLKVNIIRAKLMGIDPLLSELDHYPENFELIQGGTMCKKTGKECQIKPQVWKNVSQKIDFNGYAALIAEKSTINCWEDEAAKIIITSNGQKISKSDIWIEKYINNWIGPEVIGSLKVAGAAGAVYGGAALCTTLVGCILGAPLVYAGLYTGIDGVNDVMSGYETTKNGGVRVNAQEKYLSEVFTREAGAKISDDLDKHAEIGGNILILESAVNMGGAGISYRSANKEISELEKQLAKNYAGRKSVPKRVIQKEIKGFENLREDYFKEAAGMGNDITKSVGENTIENILVTPEMKNIAIMERSNNYSIEIIGGN